MNCLAKNFKRFVNIHRSINPMQQRITTRFGSCQSDSSRCPKGKIRTTPCKDNKQKFPPRPKPAKEEFKSMWENPPCDIARCKCPMPSFDQLYYRRSDKAKRKYQQTWVSCPKRVLKPKLLCDFPKESYPPLERRSRKDRPDTAKCKQSSLMSCQAGKDLKQNVKCLKITLPGCRGVRSSVKCRVIRKPEDCVRPANPYPSFSECVKPKIKPKRPNECECLKIRSMCEVWTILRKKSVL